MPKRYLEIIVLDASKDRISKVFDNFGRIYLSFSAGKDSTVMLHLVMDEAIKRNRKIGILFIDLEGQYKITIEHAKKCFELYKDNIELFHVCLPITLRNAVSVFEPHWICWDKDKKDAWIRELPEGSISDEKFFPFFFKGMEFEDFVPEFGEWYSNGEPTACFVGIRSDESLNRYRTISSNKKITWFNNKWTTLASKNVFNIYPIYDWRTEDLWIFHSRNRIAPYNKLYDLMYKAGLSIHQMRICQPYGDDQRRGLWLFHIIEPQTWAKVVARVNGANSGALYIQETGNINGYRKISKPENHTWSSFSKLILNSLPPETAKHYSEKVAKFLSWWGERGYKDGIPEEADPILEAKRKAPSWRRICKSLLRNDYWFKGLSFSQPKTQAYGEYLKLKEERKASKI
jgi:predicted phosphoadenosine phosphosulfate sulfurtransferase